MGARDLLYLIMAFTRTPFAGAVLFVILRGSMGMQGPLFADYRNSHIASRNRATVLSLISILLSLYLVVMRLLIGTLADMSLSYAFVFMGCVIVLASLFLRIDEHHALLQDRGSR